MTTPLRIQPHRAPTRDVSYGALALADSSSTRLEKPLLTKACVPLLLALSSLCPADELHTAPFGPGGTWNLYQLVERYVDWDAAQELAAAAKAPGYPDAEGHLVTFSSMAENQFARFLAGQRWTWIGLTDNERFGGREAGSNQLDGWKWLDGGGFGFSNWKPTEPDDWKGAGPGEDATAFDEYGRWSDAGMGPDGGRYRFIVEWETRSKDPIADAVSLASVWYSGIEWPEKVPGKWSARWVKGWVPATKDGHYVIDDLWEAQRLLAPDPAKSGSPRKLQVLRREQGLASEPWLWFSQNGSNRQEWLPAIKSAEMNLREMTVTNNCVGAIVGTIHVDKPGTYTFAVSAMDAFALRIGGLKWKSASGDGYIDPLDPLTFTQPNAGTSTQALGVLDLPAGDHVVEAVWMVQDFMANFSVLSAPGSHLTEGDTADWRPLGYEISDAKIPRLGVTEAGWTAVCSKPSDQQHPTPSLQDGLVMLEMDLNQIKKTGLPSINFAQAPMAAPAHFSGCSPFPNETPSIGDNGWVLRASARLVVPQDGPYQIGLHAQGLAALRIKGAKRTRISQSPQGLQKLHESGDTVDFNGRTNSNQEPKLVTEWDLKMGEYDIEVFYLKDIGPASFAVFSSPSGPYPPALLTAGAAALTDDIPGLPHADP